MIAILVGIALSVTCVAVLLLPFRRRETKASAVMDPIQELQHQRERVYAEVRGLRQDYDLGHIPEEEYEARFQGHRLRAASLLQQQQQMEAWSQRLEEEVQALRESPTTANGVPRCLECGEHLPGGVDQCRSCGAWPTDSVSEPSETEKR